MSKSRRPTLEHRPAITVVVVGGPETLVEAVRHVTLTTTNARIAQTDIASAATKVARSRPFAIVISEEIYSFDAAEFDALARDVKAALIAIPTEGVPQKTLQERLMPLISEAFREHFRGE
ncbi:MAG TPA: hypothetical protein VHM19_04380 [Polyangiales bacterium]|jgi:hypothetical protein|nr:hypothetical protein [Polyangiales bacterium]